jgi:hypothetical protein
MSGRMLGLSGWLGTRGVAGILASIVVLAGLSACSRDEQASSPRLYEVSATDFRYHGFPSSIGHGLFQVSFTNREGFPFRHELVVVRLQPGQNAQSTSRHGRRTRRTIGCTSGRSPTWTPDPRWWGPSICRRGPTPWPAGRTASLAGASAKSMPPVAWSTPSRSGERRSSVEWIGR